MRSRFFTAETLFFILTRMCVCTFVGHFLLPFLALNGETQSSAENKSSRALQATGRPLQINRLKLEDAACKTKSPIFCPPVKTEEKNPLVCRNEWISPNPNHNPRWVSTDLTQVYELLLIQTEQKHSASESFTRGNFLSFRSKESPDQNVLLRLHPASWDSACSLLSNKQQWKHDLKRFFTQSGFVFFPLH